MSTLKQKIAVNEMLGNGGNITKAMRKAKYKETTINTPQKLTDSIGFKEETKPIIDQLEEERQAVILEMKKKRGTAQYQHLNSALDTTTKLIQLLGGQPTDRVVYKWGKYGDEEPTTK